MKRIFESVMAAFLIVLSSCSGEDSDPSRPGDVNGMSGQRVAFTSSTNTNSDYTSTASYLYDSKGRLKEVVYGSSYPGYTGYEAYQRFEYTATSVTKRKLDWQYTEEDVYVYTLNSSGNAVSLDVDGVPWYTYTYDADGYLIERKDVTYDLTDALVYVNGDVMSRTRTYPDGNVITTAYAHYSDKENSLGDSNYGITFFGKDSKTLFKKGHCSVYNGEFAEGASFEYVFDAKGRAVEKREIYDNSTFTEYITYTD